MGRESRIRKPRLLRTGEKQVVVRTAQEMPEEERTQNIIEALGLVRPGIILTDRS